MNLEGYTQHEQEEKYAPVWMQLHCYFGYIREILAQIHTIFDTSSFLYIKRSPIFENLL